MVDRKAMAYSPEGALPGVGVVQPGDQLVDGSGNPLGAQGPKGDKGDTGATGAAGADGAPGPTGATGPPGAPGSINACWPVGSVFISVVDTDPATLLGVGTWSALGAGRVLVGLDAGDPNFDTLEETGGAKTVAATGSVAAPTISGSTAAEASHTHGVTATGTNSTPTISGSTAAEAAHTHSVTSNVTVADHASHTHTYTDVPNHTHPHNLQGGTTGTTTGTNVMGSAATGGSARAMAIATSNPTGGVATGTTAGPSATLSHVPTNNAVTSGAGSSHSHGAGTLAASAPAFTGSPVTSGAGSSHSHGVGTLAASAPSFTGSPSSVVQPYLVVRFWKRVA